ncbi:MAG: alpha/beta fold hydrolase [Clostridia bacterium]|nr:alpha/beta fold hydrolase [Clostridia bacterium]
MTKTTFSTLSSDGIHMLKGLVYLPKGEPIGIFHIVHGMTEHIGRYDKLMNDLALSGYICCGYDNLGHGNTANGDAELGYIAKQNGHELLARDVKLFADAVMTEFVSENQKLPYYLMGHSMGSFITRLAVVKYIRPDKYIIMGTGGKNPATGAGLAVIALIKYIYGDHHISPLVDSLAFGSYNKRFGGGTADDPLPWLTRDKAHREKYYADKFCTFKFTVSAMGDLIRLTKITNHDSWYKAVSKTLPILLLSGEEDPVGEYGKGVRQVAKNLQKLGCNVYYKLYQDARHEILNDSTYEQVKNDILSFLQV